MHINFLLQPHNSCQNCYGKNVVLKFCDKCMPNLGKTAISFAHFLYGFCNFLYLQTNNKTNRNSRATATAAITNKGVAAVLYLCGRRQTVWPNFKKLPCLWVVVVFMCLSVFFCD